MKRTWSKYIVGTIVVMMMCVPMLSGQGQTADKTNGAKAPKVTARVIPDSIAIGDHFTMEISITKDIMQQIAFPDFEEGKLNDQIEVLAEGPLDTIRQEGRTVELRKKYLLTTFDEGIYAIGRFPLLWIDKNITDTVYSIDSMSLLVSTFQIDTATQTIYDIKPPVKTPFKIEEVIIYILAYLFVIRPLIIAAAAFILLRRKKRTALYEKLGPVEPPHVTAIRNLEILHNQKLWQNNKHKFYYTRLTDILRGYIEGRYGIGAMEMTSDEIMQALSKEEIESKYYTNLGNVLHDADLVKFAKYVPDADANEKAYDDAYYFVENTKPTEVEEAPAGEQDELKPYEQI